MNLNDFTTGNAWGIIPEHFESMAREIHGQAATEARIFFDAKRKEPPAYEVRDGVAILPIAGTISKQTTWMTRFFGGVGLDKLQIMLAEALEDPAVGSILLNIDSPGGTIAGVETFTEAVYSARGQKPIVAYSGGSMCSAAYWIGSAADQVIVEKTANVGSIGVLLVHSDYSGMDKQDGIKRTIMTAGKYKAIGNNAEPLSKEAKGVLQERLDYIYTLFVDTVAQNRGVGAETVLNDMADGRVFIGQQAKDAGLVDEIGTLETAIDTASAQAQTNNTFYYGGTTMPDVQISTVEQLAAAFPDLAEALRVEGENRVDTGKIKTEAAAAESGRVMGLVKIQFGAEAGEKFQAVVNTGVTVEQFDAIRGAAPAESTQASTLAEDKAEILAALNNSGPENPGAGDPPGGKKDFMTLVHEHKAIANCTTTEAMQAVTKAYPEARGAYLKSVN